MISISLDKGSYSPGESIRATVTVRLDKPVRARGIYARLVCNERKKVKVDRVMDQYDIDRRKELGVPHSTNIVTTTEERTRVWFEQEKKVAESAEFYEGSYDVVFNLPSGAPPTSYEFGHDGMVHVWKMSVKLDIPLAPDENDEIEVVVSGLI